MSRALGLNLGVDFAALDRDLNVVANRIEDVGKRHALKIGAAAGDISTGKLGGSDLASAVGEAGSRLASGMASGIRSASAMMLGFTSRINAMLDKLVGTAVTLFRRIDAAMKFPAFDAFFKGAQLKLSNFSAIWRKPMNDLDLAVGGAFGSMVSRLARVFKALFEGLAATIAGSFRSVMEGVAGTISSSLRDAVATVTAEFAKLNVQATTAEASARLLVGDIRAAATAAGRFPKFPAMGDKGLRSSVPGPRIGTGTNFTAPAPTAGPSLAVPAAATAAGSRAAAAMKALQFATGFAIGSVQVLGSVTLKTGAALVSVPLRGYVAFARLSNFLSSLGDVGKSSYHKLYEGHGLLMGSVLALTKGVMGLSSALFHVGTLGAFRKAGAEATAFGRNVQAAGGMVKRLGSIVTSVGGQIVAAFGFIGLVSGVVNFFRNGIKGAADLNETVAMSKGIFGDSFGPVEAQADGLSKRFGVMRNEQLQIAAGFGAMAQGAGMTEAASAAMANQMTRMTLEFAATWQVPLDQAADAIKSGLAGQGRALKQYGVFIDEDTVKAQMATDKITAMAGAIGKAGRAAARPKAADFGAAMGSQAEAMKVQAGNATKEVERIMRIAEKPWADAMATATRQANLAKAKEDSKAEGDSARHAMKSALSTRAAWASGLLTGPMPQLPNVAKQPLKLPSDYIKAAPSPVPAVKTLTDAVGKQSEVMARAAIITNGLAYTTGALERTSSGAAAQFRKAGGGIGEFGVRIGELLLPAVTLATEGFNSLLSSVLEFVERSQATIQGWAGTFTAAMDTVGVVLRNWGPIWQVTQLRIGEFADNSVRWIGTIPANLAVILPWIGRNWWKMLLDLGTGSSLVIANILKNFTDFGKALWSAIQGQPWQFTWTPMLDGFKAMTEELPPLIRPALASVDNEVSQIWDNVAKKEADRLAGLKKFGTPAATKRPGPLDEATKKPEYKLAAAVEIGSKEASSILARSQSAGARQGNVAAKSLSMQQQTAENTRKMVDHMKSLNALAMADKFLAVK